jgi:asparagine N-glycosylation enzyme membrane subunit Stt3
MLLARASFLGVIACYAFALVVSRWNGALATALFCALSCGHIAAGLFAALVLKFRKAGF